MDLLFWVVVVLYAWLVSGHHQQQYREWKASRQLKAEIAEFERVMQDDR